MRVVGDNAYASARPFESENNCRIEIVGENKQIKDCILLARKAAQSDITVLLEGETGVGKEVFARYIHQNGKRANGPFVPVHCGAIPDALFEAEVFGFERGAFTNAYASHRGYFEQADGGTIFLDEVSEIPMSLQVKLLRVLEEKCVMRLAGEKPIRVDIRIIAASQHNLLSLVRQGEFRHDLYYRIAVWVIRIPPLRERKGDINLLAHHFLSRHGGDGTLLSDEALAKLGRYDWPGNVRELDSCIQIALVHNKGKEVIGVDDIQMEGIQLQSNDAERRRLEDALKSCGGCVTTAARLLGVHRNTVYNMSKKFGVRLDQLRTVHGTSVVGDGK